MFDTNDPRYQKDMAKIIDKFRPDVEVELLDYMIEKLEIEDGSKLMSPYAIIEWVKLWREQALDIKV